MRGEELKQLCDDSGLKSQVIYERAGYNREHFYKILKKKDVSVDEFTRIAAAVGKKPGDLLDNSASELLSPDLLPLVRQLQVFNPNALPRVQEMLKSLALLLEENITGKDGTIRHADPYTGNTAKSDALSVPVGVDGYVADSPGVPLAPVGGAANAPGQRPVGHPKKGIR